MTSRKTNIVFFLFGLAAFSYLVYRFGLDQIAGNISKAGWSLCYVVLVWLAIYLLNASAWRLVLGPQARHVSFGRIFMITVSGFVINYVTPFLALGGEPYKVNALSGLLGPRQSLSAVVLYRMVHLLGHMLLLLTGIAVALIALGLPAAVDAALGVSGAVILLVIVFTLAGHRNGVFQRIGPFIARVPLLRRAGAALRKYEHDLADMDAVITDVYHNDRQKFYASIGLEFLTRLLMGVEVYLILRGVGVEVSVPSALFLYVSYSVAINLLFFIPLNLGAREGGLALGLESLALPPLLGVYLGVVMRLREFVWILVGLSFILLASEKKPAGPVYPTLKRS
jgi:uncharacterized protein (TIRG00374 family)